MGDQKYVIASLRDLALKVDRIQADVSRLVHQKIPDQFVPVQEATRYLHCGRDWLLAQIRGGVLREGIDFIDRSASQSLRRRYLINPVSALRWLTGSDPVPVRAGIKIKQLTE
jgi:hypothetical protein